MVEGVVVGVGDGGGGDGGGGGGDGDSYCYVVLQAMNLLTLNLIIRCYNSSTNTAQVYNEIPYSLVQVRQCAVWREEN